MSDFPRYAIYYAPMPGSALARFGAECIGYDLASGDDVAFERDLIAAASDWAELTADARRYGFHATLKAPFPLAPDTTEAELKNACVAFAQQPRLIPQIAPLVDTISGFTAIVPTTRSNALNALAQDCVETFDTFRAPMTLQDRARRKPERLTARQVAQLDRYGYPFVLDDFRFHMTLTARLCDNRRADLIAALRTRFEALGLAQIPIDAITLCRQDHADSRFRIIGLYELSSATSD